MTQEIRRATEARQADEARRAVDSRHGLEPEEQLDGDLELAEEQDTEEELEQVGTLQAFFHDRGKLVTGMLLFLAAIAAIYVLFPKVVGLDDALARMDDATWYWLVIALGFNVVAFGAYVSLFRGILGGTSRRDDELHRRLDFRASYQITMAGLAATRIFSAGGAGGIALTYWALRKAGMPRRRAACRMVAFLALMYAVYPLALILFGVLLRTGVLPGSAPLAGTIVPAGIAAVVIAAGVLVSLIPEDVERRIAGLRGGSRRAGWAERLAKGPATLASGVRTAFDYIVHPRRGAMGLAGAVGFWAANIGILWASFEAFGADVPFGVLVQAFFIGMAANLIPSPAGGVGSVDAGMIAAFVLFDIPGEMVFPAVLSYRVIAFWLPIPPGIVAYFQLRSRVASWERERRAGVYTSKSKVLAKEAT
jgi:uncharacterized protein (TIRG00374 family)